MQVSNARKWWVVLVVTLGMFMATLDTSIVSVTLPQMQTAFHTDVKTITWVVTAYFLAQAAVIPIVGYLSDRFGSKQVFLITLAVFTLSSLLCALSTTIEELIIFRVLQGIGGGALLPVGFAIVYRTFPPNERASSTAIVSIPIIMAPSFGPTLGGYLGTNFNWNAIFTINVPLGIVALLLGFLYLQSDKSGETGTSQRYFDVLGLLLSIVGFTTLVYGISEASSKGWLDPIVLAFLLIGVVILGVFVIVELKVPDPVMDLRLFMTYTFSIANILTWVVMGMLYGGLFLLPLFFQRVLGETALTSGEFMIGQGIAVGVGLAVSGALYNRVGPRVLVVSGMVLMAVGTYGLTQIDVNTTGESLQLWLVARGLGIGFTTQSLQVLALSVVSNRAMARASSLYSVVRQVAGAVGLAALTTYLTQQITTHATDIGSALQAGLQTHHLTGVAATCAQAAGGANACVIQHAEVTGLADVFLVIMIFYAAGALLGLVVGRDPAIEAQKQAKKANVAKKSGEVVQVTSTRSVISTLRDNGDAMMGPEILLWRYPENDIVSLKALGFSDLDAVHHYIAMIKNETNHHPAEYQEELERSLHTILHKTLNRYADEIIALQAELEKTRAHINQSIDAQSTHLQELAHTINSDLQACISVLEAPKPSTPVAPNTHQTPALLRPWDANGTGKFKVRLAPLDQSIPTKSKLSAS